MLTINRLHKYVKEHIRNLIYTEYEKNGKRSAIDFVEEYNKKNDTKIPYEWCKYCGNCMPSIDHLCFRCTNKTKKIKNEYLLLFIYL